LREVIRAFDLLPDKRLGQHFLLDPAILGRIAAAAGDLEGRAVLEIGPGPGGLSRALLERGARLVAIERDPRCIEALVELQAASDGRLVLLEADALAVDIDALRTRLAIDQPWAIVANLPYNIGTELIVRWLHRLDAVSSLHVLLQKEVAARLVAATGTSAYGRLAVLAQSLCRVRRCFDLPPGAFMPPPKVVSSLVELLPRPAAERPPPAVLAALEAVSKAAFGQRRKMLRSSLKSLTPEPESLLASVDIAPERRAETLSLAEFRGLAEAWLAFRQSRGTA
jgi:16S rRNA (adenine1518-N6/adenine1519-N6)-dimethyltransferase